MDRKLLVTSFEVVSNEAAEEIGSVLVASQAYLHSDLYRKLLESTSDGLHSLDLGCGIPDTTYPPYLCRYFALLQKKLRCKGANVIGIDIAENPTKTPEPFTLLSGPEYDLRKPVEALQRFDDASFDLVTNSLMPKNMHSASTSRNFRHAVTQTQYPSVYREMLNEVRRLLREDGAYIEDSNIVFRKKNNSLVQRKT